MQSNVFLFYLVNFAVGTVERMIKKKKDSEAEEVDVSVPAASDLDNSTEIASSKSSQIEHCSATDLDIKSEEKFRNDSIVEDIDYIENFEIDPLAEQLLGTTVPWK